MNFPEKLKKLRKEKGLTQEELAKNIFVSRTLISKYENGSVCPTKENAEKLALFFEIKLSELIDADDTVQLVLKDAETSKRINDVMSICIISSCVFLSLLSLIPFLSVRYYDYSEGTPPKLASRITNAITLALSNGNPIVLITLITLIGNCLISFLSLKKKDNAWLKLANYSVFVVNLFLVFFSIAFVVIYVSANSYDF